MNLLQFLLRSFSRDRSRPSGREGRPPTGLFDLTEAEVVAELTARNDDPPADGTERTGAPELFLRSKEGA